MERRWLMLSVLFLARLAMAFQYQTVGSVSPLLAEAYGMGLADIGLLIGLYFAPGLALALPGGWVGQRFGEKRVVTGGLVLMALGAAISLMGASWTAEIVGRTVAGFGAILLNVLMTKMVADWFAGREIATAMAIFVNSWPFGIALALILLPVVAAWSGTAGVTVAAGALVVVALLAYAAVYAPPPAGTKAQAAGRVPGWRVGLVVVLAGAVWGLYNAAVGMVFGFGPALLAERGRDIVTAGQTTSLVLWLMALSVPLGGLVADRTGRPDLVLGLSLAGTAVALAAAAATPWTAACLVAVGLIGGLPAGPIMSLPARVLDPAERALGMGLYYTVYYVLMMMLPALAGRWADRAGTAEVTFTAGVVFLALSLASLGAYALLRPSVARGSPRADLPAPEQP